MIEMEFIKEVKELSGQNIYLCYHCHKCTSGCLVASNMTYGPDRLLRMVRMGQGKRLLESPDPWVCSSCGTCGTRCPNEIDISRVMDALRCIAVKEKVKVGEPDSVKFHRIFLGIVNRFGRMHEAGLMGIYTLWTLKLAAKISTAARLIIKGKIVIRPKIVKGKDEINRIFEKSEQFMSRSSKTLKQGEKG